MVDEGGYAAVRVVLGELRTFLLETGEIEEDGLEGQAQFFQDICDLPVT